MPSHPRSQCAAIGAPHPQTWDDYREACLSTFGGGYQTQEELDIFHHGMETMFSLLAAEFPDARTCRSANRLLTSCRIALRVFSKSILNSGNGETVTPEIAERLEAILGLYHAISEALGEAP